MIQDSFEFPLTIFEQATLEQLISYRCRDEADIERLTSNPKNILDAWLSVERWNKARIKLNLKPWS
jgi:hypothetical protein